MIKYLLISLLALNVLIYAQNEVNQFAVYENTLRDMSSTMINEELKKYQSSKKTSDFLKGSSCLKVLKERRDQKEPSASYHYGVFMLTLCDGIKQRKDATDICKDSLDSLLIASDGNYPEAMYFIGIIYRDGLGVIESKLIATDWFLKSAKLFQKDGKKDKALISLEEALKLVPDYQPAIKLRNDLLQ